MVSDLFGTVLADLGRLLEVPDLHPDRNHSCLITLKNGIQIQLEMDSQNDFLIVGSDLGPVPAGRYREGLFRQALIANNAPYPRYGTFAYSTKTDHLILHQRFKARELRADALHEFVLAFSEKAKEWKTSIEQGQIPVVATADRGVRASIFGMRP